MIHVGELMDYDFGLDIDEIKRAIAEAEVLVVRFLLFEKRLLVDARHDELEGPLLKLVPRVGSAEERFRHLKEIRPRFPLPDRIVSFLWPRRVQSLETLGIWDELVQRFTTMGYGESVGRYQEVFEEMLREEWKATVDAIKGIGYQALWQRS